MIMTLQHIYDTVCFEKSTGSIDTHPNTAIIRPSDWTSVGDNRNMFTTSIIFFEFMVHKFIKMIYNISLILAASKNLRGLLILTLIQLQFDTPHVMADSLHFQCVTPRWRRRGAVSANARE